MSLTPEELAEANRYTLDRRKRAPFDPAEPPGVPGPIGEPEREIVRAYEKGMRPARTVIGKGLGIIGWPFERVSATAGTLLDDLIHRGLIELDDAEIERKKEMLKSIGKAWISKELPKDLTTIFELSGHKLYPRVYRSLRGKEPPEWLKHVVGGATEFLATPWATGKLLKGVGAAAKTTTIPQRIQKASIPAWQASKLRHRVRLGARTAKAEELVKPVSTKGVKRLAKEISRETGKDISPQAVGKRLHQIMRGGVTARPSLQKVTNPIIEEFHTAKALLVKHGLMSAKTYATPLSRKEILSLRNQITIIRGEIGKLRKVPYKRTVEQMVKALRVKGKKALANRVLRLGKQQNDRAINELLEIGLKIKGLDITGLKTLSKKVSSMKRRFPGQTKKIQELQDKISKIEGTIKQSIHLGGEQYFPRLYLEKEEERLFRQVLGYQPKRLRKQYAKRRKDIPLQARKAMGEIKQPGYPAAKRLIQEWADIETAKLFKRVNRRWASNAWKKGYAKKPLPDVKAYGVLRNKYLPNRIHSDITEMQRVRSNFEALYDSMIGSWKLGKVIWNPATHFRNMMSNSILLDLSGVDHVQQVKYLKQALTHVKNNTREYQYAKQYLGRTSFAEAELLKDILAQAKSPGTGLGWVVNKINRTVTSGSAMPAQMYGREEFIGKFVKFLAERSKGRSLMGSVREANKWLFDYGDLAKFERLVARRIMPFYTFPRKAIPRIIEAAVTNPYGIAKYPLFASTMQKAAMAKLELSENDYAQIEKILPEYMDRGSYLLMPYRDANNDLRFFDWTYIIPWGPLSEIQTRGALDVFVSNPLIQIVADIQRNKNSFTDRPIWMQTDTPREKMAKKFEYVWQTIAPSLTPKGLYWDKLYEAATGKTYYGKKRPLPETIAHTVLGLRTQAIDVPLQKRFRQTEFNKQRMELIKKLRRNAQKHSLGDTSDAEYTKRQNQYIQQLVELGKKQSETLSP